MGDTPGCWPGWLQFPSLQRWFAFAPGDCAERTAGSVASAYAEGRSITGEFRASRDARAVAADRFSGDPRYVTEAVLKDAASGGQRFSAAATILVIGGSGYADVQLGYRFSVAGSLQATDPGERSVALLYAKGSLKWKLPAGGMAKPRAFAVPFSTVAGEHAGITGKDAAGLLHGMVLGIGARWTTRWKRR